MKIKFLLGLISLVLCFTLGYCLGHNKAKIEYVIKEVEVVKQTSYKRAVIHSRPNITRDSALKLMYDNKL